MTIPFNTDFGVCFCHSSRLIKFGRRKNLVFWQIARDHVSVGARRKFNRQKDWLIERKEILEKIKDQVRLYLGEEPSDLTLYAQSYKMDINREWKKSKLDDIYVCLQQVDVVVGGDFHPFAQAQRAHLRIMREIVTDRPVVLALECVFACDQRVVDDYLSGTIDEDVFLLRTDWYAKWGFPWEHYKPFFEFAKNNNVKIVALNLEVEKRTGASLQERDRLAGELIREACSSGANQLVYVVYGDLHIAQDKLPKTIKSQHLHGQELQVATIYLNSESIYFELMKKQAETEVEVVQFHDYEFCVLSSPPWVKWQSYLIYLEENFDIDLDADEDEWEFQIDHTDHVSNLVKMIGAALEVDFKGDDIEVYSLNDPHVLVATERMLLPAEFQLAHSLVQADRSFYIPKEGFFYLSKSTVNHAASLAGQYIHSKFCERDKMLWDFPKDFLPLIWTETMSFFLSKLVNPKRKAQTMADLKKQLQAFDFQDKGREPLLLALDQKMSELLSVYAKKERSSLYEPGEKSSYIHAARFIGEILGERYFVLFQRQRLEVNSIIDLLCKRLGDKDFDEFYYDQLLSLDRIEAEGD